MSKAQCCCGKLRLEIDGDPTINVVCHCADCQRWSGSAFGWSMYFEETSVHASGNKSEYLPGNGQKRYFCSGCGSTLFWLSPDFKGLIGVAAGSLVGEQRPPPLASYSENSRCDWVNIPTDWAHHD